MSGGHFDYNQFHIRQIADQIQYELDKQGKPKTHQEHVYNSDRIINQQKYYEVHPKQVQKKMQQAIELLNKAHAYVKNIDYYLSGDHGTKNFLSSLAKDLSDNKNEKH